MFLLYPKLRLSKCIETKLQAICFYLMLSIFLKIKGSLELVSLIYFLHKFWRKIFLLLYSINWPSFRIWLFLIREILCNMSIALVCWLGCDVKIFEINLSFLIKSFFLYDQKNYDKNLNILTTKELLRWNIKY